MKCNALLRIMKLYVPNYEISVEVAVIFQIRPRLGHLKTPIKHTNAFKL